MFLAKTIHPTQEDEEEEPDLVAEKHVLVTSTTSADLPKRPLSPYIFYSQEVNFHLY